MMSIPGGVERGELGVGGYELLVEHVLCGERSLQHGPVLVQYVQADVDQVLLQLQAQCVLRPHSVQYHLSQVGAHAAADVQYAHFGHFAVVLYELLVVRVQHDARIAELVLLDAAVGVGLRYGRIVCLVDE